MRWSVRIGRLGWLGCVLGALVLGTLPAQACGCGIYVPREGDTAVPQERALVRWDGRTEAIVMSLSVRGAAADAAWILPVPSRATVQLADAALFKELEELTRPAVQVRWIAGNGSTAGAPAGASVTVLDRQTLGPFEVSNLAAADAGALEAWLGANGYRFPPGLEAVLQHYVEHGWEYVAVKLTPAGGDGSLGGDLDPIAVSFASDELVYPMRASALAAQGVSVFLYVLADHRVTTAPGFGTPDELFAGWVAPQDLAGSPALRAQVPRRMFLTKLTQYIARPSEIDDDYHFTFAAADTPYRAVRFEYRSVPELFPALLYLTMLVGAIGASAAWLMRRRRAARLR